MRLFFHPPRSHGRGRLIAIQHALLALPAMLAGVGMVRVTVAEPVDFEMIDAEQPKLTPVLPPNVTPPSTPSHTPNSSPGTTPFAPVAQFTPYSPVGPESESTDTSKPIRLPRAVVGLPTIAGRSPESLRLAPNVALNYGPATATEAAQVAPQKSMFLARPKVGSDADLAESGLNGEGIVRPATPFRPAATQGGRQPLGDPSLETLPAPGGRADGGTADGWTLGETFDSEQSFLNRLRQRAAIEGDVLDLRVLDGDGLSGNLGFESIAPGLGSSVWPDSILESGGFTGETIGESERFDPFARRAATRMAGLVRGGFERVWETRQRVDSGLGALLVPHAPLMLDTTQPINRIRFRGDFGYGIGLPDRSEYFWAAPGRGPGFQGAIDSRELAFMFEVGGDAFSVATEIPIRGYSPQFGDGHAAVGDIRITQKTRLIDGDQVQVTQMLRVHTPSGNVKVGAGTGHTSMEPGALFRYRYNDWTYFHGELKYWIPMGGNPDFSGDVLSYGFGVSTVWYETLTTAVMPTLELTSVNFLTGQATAGTGVPGIGVPRPVSRDATAALHPGVRFAWDPGGDLGAMELGVSTGFGISRDRFYDSLLRLELRFLR